MKFSMRLRDKFKQDRFLLSRFELITPSESFHVYYLSSKEKKSEAKW